jgi:hypothetical protein
MAHRIPAALALVVTVLVVSVAAQEEKVVSGTIAQSDPTGSYLRLHDGTELYVPPDLPGVVRTELKPGRPIKAYYRPLDGRNVVTLMFTLGLHPGGGG